ncbi:CehA/McbA family metallohydrolase [Clostridium ganghwense]|uniref:CehA/McbA family metallohydrolase n=1 Tax=Clostridium ganghwense TaxID=312089 RepID=A0ABT4CSM8_9CLOT|nr:CehA/McbA family metallohydrolase [Clostridium ganghwense]MCY6371928.1 CehA/McbA family metallohydrolase [Clostridium ganghwense]
MIKTLSILTPKNNSSITNPISEISIILISTRTSDLSKIKMYLDGKKVHYSITGNKISYIPTKKLRSGDHYVKVTTTDNNGNVNKIKWSFYVEKNNLKYNFYYGIPHAHTSYSTGKGTPSEAFKYAFDKALNFLIITDHSSSLSKHSKGNKSKESKWGLTKKEAITFTKKSNNFLALRGFEVSSNHYGHFNIIGSKNYLKYKIKNFDEFTYWLNREDSPIVSINHPHKYIESFNYNAQLDKYINFIEVGNGSPPNKYLNGEKYYYKLLDKGWHLGAINGQDNHRANWGDSNNLTVVIAKSLKEKDFIDALKNRRTYSTETRTLKLTVKANNYMMGSILPLNKNIIFNLKAIDKNNPINKIELISNEATVLKSKKFSEKTKVKWDLCIPFEKNKWYVIKITHKNGLYGISSPFFTSP